MKKRPLKRLSLAGCSGMLFWISGAMPGLARAPALAAGPEDTVWDLAFLDAEHLLAASSDGKLHRMQLEGNQARDVESLSLKPGERLLHLVISPDGQRFAALASRRRMETYTYRSRLVVGRLNPLALEASYALPEAPIEALSLIWTRVGQEQRLVIGTGQGRIGLNLRDGRLQPVFSQPGPRRGQSCYNDSVVYQGQGWTAWSPACLRGDMPVGHRFLHIESWSLATGQPLSQTDLNPAKLRYGDWSTVKMAATADHLFAGLGNRALDSVLFYRAQGGEWQGKVCRHTTTGSPSAMLADGQTLYIAFQYPGKIMQLNLQTQQWGPELRGVEDPMALAKRDDRLYVGLRFGGLERYDLHSGKPVSLYLSEAITHPRRN